MRTIETELRRFDPNVAIDRAWTPPSSWYIDGEFANWERDRVFRPAWQPVARVEQLKARGDFVSGQLAGEPWVLVRDTHGELRAFHNTCRHKGREVVQGCGHAERLVCGYHAWTYDLDGTLRRAPRMAGIQDFDRHAMSLKPLAVEVWGPWVFLNLSEHPTRLANDLSPLLARLEAGGWGKLRFVAERNWDIACNWKVYVDNYLDGGYHIQHMHPSLDAQLDMGSYRTEVFERFSVQSSRSASIRDDRASLDPSQRIGSEALYVWLYPNFMLNRYGPCLDSNWVIPVAPDRCRVHYEFFFLETEGPSARRFVEESIEQSAVTQREDIAICESVQLGLQSQGYDRGRYAPSVEIGEHHFHRLLAQDLQRNPVSSP